MRCRRSIRILNGIIQATSFALEIIMQRMPGEKSFSLLVFAILEIPRSHMWVQKPVVAQNKRGCVRTQPLFVCNGLMPKWAGIVAGCYSNILLNFWKKLALAVAPGFMLSLVRSFSMASFSSRERFSGI